MVLSYFPRLLFKILEEEFGENGFDLPQTFRYEQTGNVRKCNTLVWLYYAFSLRFMKILERVINGVLLLLHRSCLKGFNILAMPDELDLDHVVSLFL